MKILIMSDSHDNVDATERVMRFANNKHIDHIIHCGDVIAPFTAKKIIDSLIPVTAVYGNNDGEFEGLQKAFNGNIYTPPYTFNLYNDPKLRIMITHDLKRTLINKSDNIKLVCFGHTHKTSASHDGDILIINPGEVCGWLSGKTTVCVLDTETFKPEFVEITTRGNIK